MKHLFFSYPVYASFVRSDEALLKKHFNVTSFHFRQQPAALPFAFIRQLFVLLFFSFRTDCYVSFFAGYSSFLPAVFARLSGKPHVIILGGTDCASFPSIGYGNFQKNLLGWFTCRSLKMATRLLPVDESLVDSAYNYTHDDFPRQGYKNFCATKAPHTTIHIGYDPEKFFFSGEKTARSFLTVAQMNAANFYRKGIDLIFEMARRFPDCTFTIVGNNETMHYDSVPGNISLLPFVPYEELRAIYSAHEFYFQLSIMEGFPSAPCEAMLCECIPIVSAVAALPHIVGDAGFILAEKNAAQLEQLLQAALSADREALRKMARQRIISLFPKDLRLQLAEVVSSEMKRT